MNKNINNIPRAVSMRPQSSSAPSESPARDSDVTKTKYNSPLADRMRPQSLDEFLGQEEVVGKGKLLRQAIESDIIPSMIFWGPPGTGKTTLSRIIVRDLELPAEESRRVRPKRRITC